MTPDTRDIPDTADRRAFLGAVAAGTLGLAAAPAAAAAETSGFVQGEPWLAPLRGKHKQVFDAPSLNGGLALAFVHNYLTSMAGAYSLSASEVNAMLVVRYVGIGYVLSDAVWARYKLGTMWNITDPATKAPTQRNLWINSKPGDMPNPAASLDRLLARGVVVGACDLALKVMSGAASANAGVTPDVALAEWKASLLPGIHLVPSGVMAVGRAQESGCTYCFAG